MERLPMCRMCLSENVRLGIVASINLHELYEKLTDIPFVTEDSRPKLACVFCCAKLNQCYRLMRQYLQAENFFAQRMNDKSEPNSIINENRSEVFGGLMNSPVKHINIDSHIAVEEDFSAVCGGPDNVMEPKKEYHSDELEPENLDNSCQGAAGVPHYYELDLEYEVPLLNCKTELEDEEVSKCNKLTIKLEPETSDNSCSDVADIPPHCYESDLEDDVPLINCKIEVEDEEMSKNKRNTEAIKPTFRSTPTEQTIKQKSEPQVIRTDGKWTFKPGTYFKEPYTRQRPSSNKVKKEYKCNVCPRICIDKNKLTVHIRVHTGEKPYECNICKRNFSRKGSLTEHMRKHTGEKTHKCHVCQRNFREKRFLRQHMVTHTVDKPFECNSCQRNFRQKRDLIVHIRTHSDGKPYECDFCQRNFSLKQHLTQHMLTHTDDKPFGCNFCQRNFRQKSNLTVHMRTHTGDKPYECVFCQRNFNRKNHLTQHMLTHTGDKPFECNSCQRNFRQKSTLIMHMRTHTDDKPFECNFCRRNFRQKSYLTVHMRTHNDNKPYECDFCQRTFTRKSNLIVHMRIHTGDKPYECDFCQRNFRYKSNLTVHMRTHNDDKPYECDFCQRNFNRKYHLTQHMLTHTGDNPFECNSCQRNLKSLL